MLFSNALVTTLVWIIMILVAITGGTINFGSKATLKETVLYLPNTDFLTPPPVLPDKSSK